jgi:ribosomal protein L29
MRKRLLDIRMDIYTPTAQHAGEKRKLRRNLARLLTVLSEERRGGSKADAPATKARAPAAAKPSKAAAAPKAKATKTTKKSK